MSGTAKKRGDSTIAGEPSNQRRRPDSSGRRQADAAVRQREQQVRAILDACPIPQFVIDAAHRVIQWNKALESYSGISREEVLGTDRDWRAFYGQARPCLADLLVDGADDDITNWYAGRCTRSKLIEDAYEATDYFPGIRGGTWLYFTAAPIRDNAGRMIGAVETLMDVTEHKRAEEALRQGEERYRQFFEMDLTADFISLRNGVLGMCNPAYVNMFGFASQEEALRTNVVDLYPSAEKRLEFLDLLRRSRTLSYHEMELRRRDGSPLFVIANFVGTIDENGDLASIQGYLFDETPRKLLERQLLQAQKMEAIGILAGGIAHDFNNMLGVILGVAELALEKTSPLDPLRRAIETIRNAAVRSADVTQQLLAFARRQAVEPKAVDLNSSMASMQLVLGRLIGEDVELTMVPGKDLWPIRIDTTQVDQILANLATNARDAIEDVGTITIETANVSLDEEFCRTHVDATPGDHVMLSFSDTGCGMDPATLEKVFDPFFTTKPEGKGTGLGLSTVYGIVRQNNGSIVTSTEPGKGTTFRMYFPRFAGETASSESRTEILTLNGTETVLVVEDEEQLLDLARMTLEEYGYRVLTARTPGEAILASEKHDGEIHLLLTDVVMPMMNGRELDERIRRTRPSIRTIFMSGFTGSVIDRLGIRGMGVPYIQKPFAPRFLATKVREVLNER